MSITSSDLKFYKSVTQNDTVSNGGGISATQVTDNVLNNLFPNVSSAERVAGVTRYRKMFIRNKNTAEYALQNTEIWVDALSSAGDYFRLKAGTDSDIQSAADDYTNWLGSGTMQAAVGSGETSFVVDYDAADGIYNGSKIRIDDGVNDIEKTVNAVPIWNGNSATITVSGQLGVAFATPASTIVSSVLELGTVEPSYNGWTEHFAGTGAYDEATSGNIAVYNVGTVTDSWTITFSGATQFTCAGLTTGSVASGQVSVDYQPANGGSYYFKIDKDGWSGTPQAGDTINFNTVHAGKAIWVKEVVPASTPSYASNVVTLALEGESA